MSNIPEYVKESVNALRKYGELTLQWFLSGRSKYITEGCLPRAYEWLSESNENLIAFVKEWERQQESKWCLMKQGDRYISRFSRDYNVEEDYYMTFNVSYTTWRENGAIVEKEVADTIAEVLNITIEEV